MTRGYVDLKKHETELRKLFKDQGEEALFKTLIEPRKNDDIFNAAARIVRLNATGVARVIELVRNSMQSLNKNLDIEKAFKGFPMMIPGAKDDTIRVFPSLLIDPSDPDVLKYCSWVLDWTVLDPFMAVVNAERNDPRKKEGWAPLSRAITRLTRYEDMTTARALKRYTGFHDEKDDVIQNIAAGVDEQRKPVELIFAETPEEFIEMYRTGPTSCMSWQHGQEGRAWAFMPDDCKIHPTSFFSYYPYAKGVYIKFKGVVACRTIMYNTSGNKWEYGRVYTTNAKMLQVFENALKDKGITKIGTRMNRKVEFEVPSITHPKVPDPFMPFPYFDDMDATFNVTYNADKGVFKLTNNFTQQIRSNTGSATTSGYIRLCQINVMWCACHSYSTLDNPNLQRSLDGLHYFCGSGCSRSIGYVPAQRADGQIVYVASADAYHDVRANKYYTNVEACVTLGGFPPIDYIDTDNPDDLPEDSDPTTVGTLIRVNDRLFRLQGGSSSTLGVLSERYSRKIKNRKYAFQKSLIRGFQGFEIVLPESITKRNKLKVEIHRVKTVVVSDKEQFIRTAA